MFDTIEVTHACSNCEEQLQDYQTKALDNLGDRYQLGDSVNRNPDRRTIIIGSFEIYDYCSGCTTRIEGRAYVKDGLLSKVVEFDEQGIEKVIAEYVPGRSP